jgi:FkbM family methyltransferase
MALLLHLLRTDDLFVDVGANIGSYTILAAKVCGCPSMSVEPGGPALAALRRNISANGISSIVSVQPVALGAAETDVLFSSGLGTMNHVLEIETSSHESPEGSRVPMRMLDSLLPSFGRWPILIKVDVEGFEQQVLEGAAQTLCNPSLLALLLETVTTKSAAMLNGHGFAEASYDPFNRVLGSPGEYRMSNRLFVRNPDQIGARVKRAPTRTIHGVPI